jgi:hypothetical protein
VKNREAQLAESYFTQIVEKDPENMEVQQLKLELDIWQKEEERKKLEQAARDAARKAMVDALAPGKTFYLKRDWYKSILKLEEFLNRKGNDEDLVKEASDMLSDARSQLSQDIGPLLDERITKTLELSAAQAKLNVVLEKEQRVFEFAGEMISQGFEDAILSGQKLGEVVRALGQDLLRLVFRQQITAPLAKGIGDALFAGFRAEGGPVGAGSAYVVGEKGPELFVPSSSGSIVPNGAMGSSGGGSGGVTVNYNIAAGVSRAELVPILEQERRRLKAEIPDMVRRGGSYRSAFA